MFPDGDQRVVAMALSTSEDQLFVATARSVYLYSMERLARGCTPLGVAAITAEDARDMRVTDRAVFVVGGEDGLLSLFDAATLKATAVPAAIPPKGYRAGKTARVV